MLGRRSLALAILVVLVLAGCRANVESEVPKSLEDRLLAATIAPPGQRVVALEKLYDPRARRLIEGSDSSQLLHDRIALALTAWGAPLGSQNFDLSSVAVLAPRRTDIRSLTWAQTLANPPFEGGELYVIEVVAVGQGSRISGVSDSNGGSAYGLFGVLVVKQEDSVAILDILPTSLDEPQPLSRLAISSRRQMGSAELLAPEVLQGEGASVDTSYTAAGNGVVEGFLSGVSSDKTVDSAGVHTVRKFSVRWGSPDGDSEFELLPSTSLSIGGKDLSSATATDKAAALARLNLDGSTTAVNVSFESSSGVPGIPTVGRGYRRPVAIRVRVYRVK